MIYRFTEVLNDLVNYFLLGDILLLEDWKQANHLSDDLAMEFTTNESGDRIFAEGIVIPMTGIENYPYTILFNLSGDRPELCKERNRLQLRKSGYSLKVDHNMLMLFTWPILEQFTPEKVKDLISYYRVHKKPMIELANGWYHIEILGGETLQDGDYEPTFEFVIQPATNEEATINADMSRIGQRAPRPARMFRSTVWRKRSIVPLALWMKNGKNELLTYRTASMPGKPWSSFLQWAL